MVSIVNCNIGNVGSVANMIKKAGGESTICYSPDDLKNAKKIILPGVGTFDAGMKKLAEGGWIGVLNEKAITERIPVLGICLGMQLMANSSEEGSLSGLAWVPGKAVKFSFDTTLFKVPHMGWNDVTIRKDTNLIDPSFADDLRYYFVHAYYMKMEEQADEMLSCDYGGDFTCGFERGNLLGVQFHPEKSHKYGLHLIKNFLEKY